ncbi:outer membrane protein [Polymorphum gilvum]|uniref:Porin subfamily n=1 Tax=Polymorphum gilvum (strain LMG 25793 / CGMCC 1.9160 / SL003B-26A1) TaxID=991905 RepID=F2IX68_POLGS|nr:outer membrane protein [Polymorphum gilvum]ADZ69359.1 Porin subfamily [Polymorphum gilvum SL003B-26A1]
MKDQDMGSVFKQLSLAGVAMAVSTAVFAADMPAPIIEHIPEVPAVGGWYLRGDIGYKLYEEPKGSFNDPVVGNLRFRSNELDDAWMIGAGVGYKFTDYFRADLTVDYETPAGYKGLAPCAPCFGSYSVETADIDVWTVMLNGYVDIGTWYNITPYVGAGIGAAWVNVSNVKSTNPGAATTSYDGSHSQWNLAWALMAGASYAVTPNWSIDAGYRYKNLGDAKSVKLHNVGTGQSRVKYKDLTAHEIRLGVRYNFDSYAASAPQSMLYPSEPITRRF